MEEIENPQSLIKTHYEQMLFEEKEWSYYWLDHNFAFLHTVFSTPKSKYIYVEGFYTLM